MPTLSPEREDEEHLIPFRIQFASTVIAPNGLPDFPYTSTALQFNCVVYTAIVWAADQHAAVGRVQRYWPEANLRFLEQGQRAFKAEDYLSRVEEYGSYHAKRKVFWLKRIFKWD